MYFGDQQSPASIATYPFSKASGMDLKGSSNDTHSLIGHQRLYSNSSYDALENQCINDMSEFNISQPSHIQVNRINNGTNSSIPSNNNNNDRKKRDWMSTLNSVNHYIASKGVNSLMTSVKVGNKSQLPSGWEQYMDLKSGETYYVNWKTRTKHSRLQCPEVQKCLAEAMALDQLKDKTMNNFDSSTPPVPILGSDDRDQWLVKMTATTSALAKINTKNEVLSKNATDSQGYQKFANFSTSYGENGTTNLIDNLMHKHIEKPRLVSQADANQQFDVVVCSVCNMFVMVSASYCPNCNTIISSAASPSRDIVSTTSTSS